MQSTDKPESTPYPSARTSPVARAGSHLFLELEPPEACLRHAPHVVIVGGCFAGVHACKALANADVRITLIDKRNFNLFQPLP